MGEWEGGMGWGEWDGSMGCGNGMGRIVFQFFIISLSLTTVTHTMHNKRKKREYYNGDVG